jgi:hypothetical protein
MIREVKKSELLGAMNLGAQRGKIAIPTLTGRDSVMLVDMNYENAWPDVVLIFEQGLMVIRMQGHEACTYIPFKRLDDRQLRGEGLLKFKDQIESSKAVYLGMPITYCDIAELALKHDLTSYLYTRYAEAKGIKK